MKVAEFFKKNNFHKEVDTKSLLKEFDSQMSSGLDGNIKSLKMIPAYLDIEKPVPSDTPVIVLDAGGTNLRVAVIWFDKSGKPRIEDFNKYPMPGTTGVEMGYDEFFDKLAEYIEPVSKRAGNIGFCFSYATEITPTLDGKLLHWTKQVAAPEVEGKMIGTGIAEALKKRNGIVLDVRILNDTVATLLAGKSAGMSRRYSSYIGFILGTGTNIAYIESNKNIGKVSGLPHDRSMVINVESGNFDGAPQSDIDKRMDAATRDPGVGTFEKMISGGYMGGLGLAVLQSAAEEGLFSKTAAESFLTWNDLSTKDFDDFVANPFITGSQFDQVELNDADRRIIMELGETVFCRAAGLVAANVSAAVLRSGAGRDKLHPVCINIDGSTYYKTRSVFFKSRVEQGLREILGGRGVHFETISVDDAPMVGAAVAGLIA
jgi:hexokinase